MNEPAPNTNQKKHMKRAVTNIRGYFKQYCDSTSIHGFKYFGEDRSTFEKIWWTIVFILCLSGCCIMIYKSYEKYEKSPVIVTFATKETSIYKIPFPAVTICPEIKSEKKKFNFTEVLKRQINQENLTDTERKNLEYVFQLCDQEELDDLENETKTYTSDFFNTLNEIKPDFMGSVLKCKIYGANFTEQCSDILTPVLTDEGVCYSFNILDRGHIFNDLVYHYEDYHKVKNDTRSWNMEQGYLNNSEEWPYPWRALFSGVTNGLTLYLMTESKDIDFMCRNIQGFKVVLHSPVRIPRLKQDYFRVPLNQAVLAAVQPVMITTSEAVKSFDVDKRDCYFPSEKKMKYFRTYSQQNCALECLTNITLKRCGCVDFFMPRDSNTSICGLGKHRCMKEAEELRQDDEYYKFYDSSQIEFPDCNCLPLCTDLTYNVEISQTQWDWKEMSKMFVTPEVFEQEQIHLSSLTVYFKFNHFTTSERHELYVATDFVANFGGLLGLFTGFSILSLMEIMYFLTVRICCNVHLYGKWIGNTPN